ncbi:sigma factor-like helix-turn-helix DNA-binding protein [Clostridium sp.]|uniref:RNA polymerase sigma factor n=1 Tax=Clostridium sp. TaxID=1506 RepID=UPI0032163B1F
MMSLNENVILAKKGSSESLKIILEKFEKLIQSISGKHKNEYLETDLTIFLLKLIYKIDEEKIEKLSEGALVMYLVNSLKYESIRLLKVRKVETVALLDIYSEIYNEFRDKEFDVFLNNLVQSNILTPKQRLVLKEKYVNDFTDKEIAIKISISRRAVTRLHNTAISNLRNYLN